MLKYVLKRILIFIPTLIAISMAIFFLNLLAPGDPVENMLNLSGGGESGGNMADKMAQQRQDQFISSDAAVEDLRQRLPTVACIEMEGAAVAQVCEAFHVPFSVIRTISDSANDEASVDFPRFIDEVAKLYSLGIMKCLLGTNKIG